MIERLTYTATCELFLSSAEISLRHVFDEGVPYFLVNAQSKSAITGTLLTHQLTVLESIVHKDGVPEAIFHVLQDLLAVYDPKKAALQRAGALLTGLSMLWRDRRTTTNGNATWGDTESMGKEALELLERDVS